MSRFAPLCLLLLAGCGTNPSTAPQPALPSVPKNAMALRTYRATMPPGPKTFTLRCEISDYYNGPFRDAKDTHYSVRLMEAGTNVEVQGYVEKDSALGKRIFGLLGDGKRHTHTFRLQYGDGKDSDFTSIVGLTD